MGKMAQLLHMFQTAFQPKQTQESVIENTIIFDKKYKLIVKSNQFQYYVDMMDWIDQHSNGNVDVKMFGDGWMYFLFENPDDAIIFKIKYSI